MSNHISNNDNDYILRKISKKEIDTIDLFGISIALLYSKEIFNKNQDISAFLKTVYNIDFLPYVMRSRTLIAARITKELNKKDQNELEQIKNSIMEFLSKNNVVLNHKKPSKKKDANDKMKTWLEGL